MACLNRPLVNRLPLRRTTWLVALAASLNLAAAGDPEAAARKLILPENPFLRGADPHTALVDGTFWMYPTHYRGYEKQFYAYASRDLLHWKQYGPVLSFKDVRWINDDGAPVHHAWAPCLAEKNGKFYFYFSVGPQNPTAARIGVAVGDSPTGPFVDTGKPLLTGGNGFEAIDPMVFADPQTGTCYFYAGGSAGATLRVFELAEDMVSFAREIKVENPLKFTEGAFMHYHNGVYYLSYSHGNWQDASYSLHYATATTPVGPWQYRGAFLVSDANHKGPGHHSIVHVPGSDEAYLFYHRWNAEKGSGPFHGSRQVAVEKIGYDAEGLIRPVRMTGGVPIESPKKVPGVVIDYSPQASGLYIGSPSIAVWTNGDYIASHDFFGPKSQEHECATVAVFRSQDRGATWSEISRIKCLFWANLFTHRGALYIMGTEKHHGRILLRRSVDGGQTWTDPRDTTTGLLTPEGQFHTAPMPMVEHNGRLWRAFEDAMGGTEWGKRYRARMLSVPADADLLNAENWVFSNPVARDPSWLNGTFNAWLEGNAVLTRSGEIWNMLRVDLPAASIEKAAIVKISPDGKTATFDPETGFVDFPGGAKKFTIRYDAKTDLYWSIATIVHERHFLDGRPAGIRNTLALTASPDLKKWSVRCLLLYHPDRVKHGFQYVDWLFEGDDIITACRTAYDDEQTGARNNHDANFLTFHRLRNFRELTMDDSVPVPQIPLTRYETAHLLISGTNYIPAAFCEGDQAFSNREYVWQEVPGALRGGLITKTGGGRDADLRVRAKTDTVVLLATALIQPGIKLQGWDPTDWTFHYNDAERTRMTVFRRELKAGMELIIPQGNWTGGLVIVPPDEE